MPAQSSAKCAQAGSLPTFATIFWRAARLKLLIGRDTLAVTSSWPSLTLPVLRRRVTVPLAPFPHRVQVASDRSGDDELNKTRNRNQRNETGQSNGNQPAGRHRNRRTPVTEPRRHVTETGAITQGFFCIEDIAIVITSSSKHGFCRQTQCPQAIRCQSRLRVAVFSQVLGASTCSPAHRRDWRQSFAGLVGAAILTLAPTLGLDLGC